MPVQHPGGLMAHLHLQQMLGLLLRIVHGGERMPQRIVEQDEKHLLECVTVTQHLYIG